MDYSGLDQVMGAAKVVGKFVPNWGHPITN